jgi:hypothetical protein
MRVVDYLRAKYGTANATTILHCEAKALGIPYPPPHGWTRTYGEMEITADAAERLRAALKKNKNRKESAAKGLEVLRAAWIVLKTRPDANAPEFLQSKAWKRLRFQALKTHGMACQACGASPSTGAVLNVDHIFPRRLFPHLALRLDNLQVLCAECNEGKANWDMTDARKAVT